MSTQKSTQTLLNFADPTTARTSLFMSTDGLPFTTSRAIAERFGKNHKNVLKIIKKLLSDMPVPEFGRLHFEPSSYLNAQQKTQPEYKLTHDGFALLVMGFTGKEAMAWKVAFLTAFNQMESEVKANQQRFIHALDIVRPALRPVTESFQLGESRTVTASRIGKSVNAVTYHRRKARQLGLLAH
jgi:Rha family phage regulatory protein